MHWKKFIVFRISKTLAKAVPTLIEIAKHKRFAGQTVRRGLGGAQGLKELVRVVANVTRAGGGQSVARETLRVAKRLLQVNLPASGRYIQLIDIGRVFDNLGADRFNIYMEALKYFRREKGYFPGILAQASVGSSRNFLDVAGSGRNAVNYAMEIVATKWLIQERVPIKIRAGESARGLLTELPAIQKVDIEGFGWKHQRNFDPRRTLEADLEFNLPQIDQGFALDWKNYWFSGKLKASDIAKAVEALKNRAVDNVIFLSPRVWSAEAIQQIADAMQAANLKKGLLLGQVIAEGELARFLR